MSQDDALIQVHLAYWRQQLRGELPVLELPTDRPRPRIQTFHGASQSLSLPQSLIEALKALSHQEDVTLFMTLLAAFKTLLYRYTSQTDLLVGTPIANRNQADLEPPMDLFVNTLVLRTDLSGNPTFCELLKQVTKVTLGAYAHQDLPFEKLVEELQPERNLSYSPLFQVMFALQTTPSQLPQLDLILEIIEEQDGLKALFTYNTDLFDVATISQMTGHFQTLLEGIVAAPKQRLLDLPLLTEAERYQLLVAWNDTKIDYPHAQGQCLHHLIEAQVERTPEAIAVISKNQQLTYRELNAQANQLAYYLKKYGVGPEVLVGICTESSLEMVIGLLGILKAGGAYVPLDPAYPKERLAFMLEDAQVSVLLTQQQRVAQFPSHEAQVICLDSDWPIIAQESQTNPTSGVMANHLAYVIYTSGSTGKPKGVLIPHQALVNHNVTMAQLYKLGPNERVLQFASISFDVAAEELFPSWLSGATVVLQPKQGLTSFTEFLQFLEKEQLTVLNLPTPYWHEWVSELSRSKAHLPSHLRLVIIGSEKALPEQLTGWQELVGNRIQLLNAYGPTEATITTTIYQPSILREQEGYFSVPIGRPIANTQVYLLDQYLNPVPLGLPGELYIGGAGLARGYFNQPELTAEKFVQNPFSHEPGARLYKTGDVGRYLSDGNIEFRGRIDQQVKIRGFRIELEEIGAVLQQHQGVHEAVVIAREDIPGDKRLIAYVVPQIKPSTGNLPSELRRFLREKLPDYMIPATFVLLDTLPLTPNGKINRPALPAPNLELQEPHVTFIRPRDTLELILASIWHELLGIPTKYISITDNFFEVGGHSLLAVSLIAEIHRLLGQELHLSVLIQEPTIEHLATILRQSEGIHATSPLIPIQIAGTKQPFFCVHPAGGNPLGYVNLSLHLGTDQPFYVLQSPALDNEQDFSTSIERLATAYLAELQAVQPQGPYLLGGFCMGAIVAFEMAQQLQAQGQKVALLALLEPPFPALVTPQARGLFLLEQLEQCFVSLEYSFRKGLRKLSKQFLGRTLAYIPGEAGHIQKKLVSKLTQRAGNSQNHAFTDTSESSVSLKDTNERSIYWDQLLKANDQAIDSYRPQPYSGPIVLFFVKRSPSRILRLIWSKLAAGTLQVHIVPGRRMTMMSKNHAAALAKTLKACLDQAQADDGPEKLSLVKPLSHSGYVSA